MPENLVQTLHRNKMKAHRTLLIQIILMRKKKIGKNFKFPEHAKH